MNTVEFTENQEKEVTDLCETIRNAFRDFNKETVKPRNKSAARRARKLSMEITRLLKNYREASIK